MTSQEGKDPVNWVDPDIIAYYESSGSTPVFDEGREREFKEFFETGWLDPKYDDLRDKWDPLINDTDPYGRLYGKTALWSLVRLRAAQERTKEVKRLYNPDDIKQ